MTADPVRRLRARLSCFATEQDPAIVLDGRAVAEADEVMAAVGDRWREHAEAVALVALLRWYRFQLSPEPDDQAELDEVIRLFGNLVEQRPDLIPPAVLSVLRPDPVPGSMLASMSLIAGYLEEHRQTRTVEALYAAAMLLCRALTSGNTRAEEEDGLTALASDVLRCYAQITSPDQLHEGPKTGSSGDGSQHSAVVTDLARVLNDRHQNSGAAGQITDAVPVEVSTTLSFLDKAGATVDPAQVADSIGLAHTVAKNTPDTRADHAETLCGLAAALLSLTDRTGNPTALSEAITALRQAIDLTPAEQPDYLRRVVSFTAALFVRYQRTGMAIDLDEAIDASREIVARTQDARRCTATISDYTEVLSNLGLLLFIRFERTSMQADLEESLTASQRASNLTPHDHPEHPHRSSILALVLRVVSEKTGRVDHLDEAIHLLQAAISRTPVEDPDYPGRLSNLALVLRARYQRTGAVTDLDEAIELSRNAAEHTPRSTAEYANTMSNLGLVLRTRAELTGSVTDLDEAIDTHLHAISRTPVEHPDYPGRLSNLALALRARYQRTGAVTDLDEAIELSRKAVEHTPLDHPDSAGRVSNLALALRSRYEVGWDRAKLTEATLLSREAVARVPYNDPAKAGLLLNLGGVLAEYRPVTPEWAEAIGVFEQILSMPDATWSVRATAAMTLGELAARNHDWRAATRGFERAIDLVGTTARRVSDRDGQTHLVRFSGLASNAVACALNAGENERAVELFERSRGILYSRALDLDLTADLSELSKRAPLEAERLAQLRDLLSDDTVAQRGELNREWDELIAEIRAWDGYSEFLKAPSLAQMLHAANEGPIVLLNVSEYRSDAIVLADDSIRVIRLPLDPQAVEEVYSLFTASMTDGETLAVRRVHERWVSTVLEWLWDTVVGKVLDQLGLFTPDPAHAWPRVWWCPSGLMSFLPLHAAGWHGRPGGAGQADNALDRVISSYIPTVRALIHSRFHSRREAKLYPEQVLGVAMGYLEGVPGRLQGARIEAKLIRNTFPEQSSILEGEHATTEAVLAAMQTATVVHFSCHGYVDANDSASSGLVLADGPLTVRDISKIHLADGAFAYLSACSTARRSEQLPDEPVTLASAFALAGYRNVVANLWDIDDRTSVRIADFFYSELTRENRVTGPVIATALHAATRKIRDASIAPARFWTATIHVGP